MGSISSRKRGEGREIDLKNFDTGLPLKTAQFQVKALREALATYASWLHLCSKVITEAARTNVKATGKCTPGVARARSRSAGRPARGRDVD